MLAYPSNGPPRNGMQYMNYNASPSQAMNGRPMSPGMEPFRPMSPGMEAGRPMSPGMEAGRPMSPGMDLGRQMANGMDNGRPVPSGMDTVYTNPYYENNTRYGKNANKVAVHRPRLNRKNPPTEKKSTLTTNFDPMKDRHMWAMWRTAVNGRIVDQVRRNEQVKHDAASLSDDPNMILDSDGRSTMYGKDLTSVPPLSRFIRLNQRSKNIAQDLMNEGQGKLETTQFIYYGLPRVTVSGHTGNNNNARYDYPPADYGKPLDVHTMGQKLHHNL